MLPSSPTSGEVRSKYENRSDFVKYVVATGLMIGAGAA